MKVIKNDKWPPLNDRDEVVGSYFSQELENIDKEKCYKPHEIAAAVEGQISSDEKDRLLKHIASCPYCYDTFLLAMDLQEEKITPEKKKINIPYRYMAVAASILVVVFSVYLFYTGESIPKTPEALYKQSEEREMRPAQSIEMETLSEEKEELEKKEKERSKKLYISKKRPEREKAHHLRKKNEKSESPTEEIVVTGKAPIIDRSDAAPPPPRQKGALKAGVSAEQKKEEEQKPKPQTAKEPDREKSKAETYSDETYPGKKDSDKMTAGKGFGAAKYKKAADKKTTGLRQKAEKPAAKPEEAEKKNEFLWKKVDNQNISVQNFDNYIPGPQLREYFENSVNLTNQLQGEFASVQSTDMKKGNYKETNRFVKRIHPTFTAVIEKDDGYVLPDIRWFQSKSAPGSIEYRFFTLACSGWCNTPGACYNESGGPPRWRAGIKARRLHGDREIDKKSAEKLLVQWQELYPRLTGVFKRIASHTITRLRTKIHDNTKKEKP